MKKNLFRTILVLAALAACNKEVETPTPAVDNGQEEVTPGKVTLTFKAAIDDGTRTVYANDKTASWQADDAISVCLSDGTNYEVVDFTTTDGIEFSAEVTQGYEIVSGVYPANDVYSTSQDDYFYSNGTVKAVYLPDTYNLGTANDGGIALPMVGQMDDDDNDGIPTFKFHHICGALKIEVIDIFDALTFTTAETITGSFDLNSGRIAMPAEGTGSTVTFNYGRLASNPEVGERDNRTFYIPIPDGTITTGATMALKTADAKTTYEKTTPGDIAFDSNKIKRLSAIGFNRRTDWSITPDLTGAKPFISFTVLDDNQLYIRLSTTKSNFEDTYHGSVAAFLEARLQSSANSTQTGSQPYTPNYTIEEYVENPDKVFIMCGVNKTGSTNRKCDFDYQILSVTVEDPATDAYRAWLGQWTVSDGTNNDTWTIARDNANSSYVITGLAGQTSIGARGVFSVSDGSLSLSSQSEIGSYVYSGTSHNVSLLKRSNSSGNPLSSGGNAFGLVFAELLLNNEDVTIGETNNAYGYYWRNDANTGWTTVASLKRNKISSMTRVAE